MCAPPPPPFGVEAGNKLVILPRLYYYQFIIKDDMGGTHVQFHSVCSKRPALPKQCCKPERKGKTLNKTRGGYIHVENCELKSLPGFICPVELSQRGSCLISVYDTRKDTLGVCFSFALSLPPRRRRRLLFTWYVSSIGIFLFFLLQVLFAQRLVGARFCH